MFQCSSRNRIQHFIQLLKHLNISKPKKLNAEGFDESFTFAVSRLGPILKMTVSVKLNGKSEFSAIKVNNVSTHTVLAAKLVAEHLSSSQFRPED